MLRPPTEPRAASESASSGAVTRLRAARAAAAAGGGCHCGAGHVLPSPESATDTSIGLEVYRNELVCHLCASVDVEVLGLPFRRCAKCSILICENCAQLQRLYDQHLEPADGMLHEQVKNIHIYKDPCTA